MLTLLDLSTIWYIFHAIFLNAILYESRFPRKKTVLLTILFMTPLAVYNSWFYVHFGTELTGRFSIVNCTIPSLVFFWSMAKRRNGRLLFTFCLSDTISLELVYLTRFIDDALGLPNHWVLFILRLISWPLLEWTIIKYLRQPYLRLQRMVDKGWGLFAAVTFMFYVLLVVMATYPTLITERWEYLPALLLVMLLMPLIYGCILRTLYHQQKFYDAHTREQLLMMQTNAMQQYMEQSQIAEKQMAIQRHDLRHRFQTIDALLEKEDFQTARQYIAASDKALQETKIRRWCLNPILDAVLGTYFRQAEMVGIQVEADLDIPEQIPVDANQLSVVFANALENAIHAVESLPAEKKVIRCKCIQHPQMMFRVSNPYEGTIRFDKFGLPMSTDISHGLGAKSIAAYCEKNGAYCEYKTENGWFTLQIIQP